MKECDNSKIHYKQQLHIVCMSSNNVGHLITKTITILQHFATLHHTSSNYTSLQLSTFHFLSFTLHYPLIWLNPITFPIVRIQNTPTHPIYLMSVLMLSFRCVLSLPLTLWWSLVTHCMSLLPEAVTARRLSSKTMSIAAAGPSPVDLLTYYFPSFPFLLSFQTKFVWQNSLLDLFLLLSWCCCPSLFLFFPHPFFSHSCWSPVSSVRVVGVFVTRNPSTARQESDFTWGRPAA